MLLGRILKRLEKQRLIRTIRTVAVKNRKMYILEGITPAKELTGGVWCEWRSSGGTLHPAIMGVVVVLCRPRRDHGQGPHRGDPHRGGAGACCS